MAIEVLTLIRCDVKGCEAELRYRGRITTDKLLDAAVANHGWQVRPFMTRCPVHLEVQPWATSTGS